MSIIPILLLQKAGAGGGGVTPPPDPPPDLSNQKNVQNVPNTGAHGDYPGFGFLCHAADPDIKRLINRIGTGHLVGGKIYYQNFTLSTRTWGNPILLIDDAVNIEDCAGGLLRNGNTIVFTTRSYNGFGGGDATVQSWFQLFDEDMNPIGGRVDIIGGSSGVPALDRGWAFGTVQAHDDPSTYSINLVQLNTSTAPAALRRISILKTTDNWATFTRYQIMETTVYSTSENVSHYIGAGKMYAQARLDLGGPWMSYKSTDGGQTWTGVGRADRVGYYNAAVKIYHHYFYDGLLYILYQDRDNGFMMLSALNDPNNYFNAPDAATQFNDSILLNYTDTPSSDYNGLGYGTMVDIDDDVFLMSWTKETQGDGTGGTAGHTQQLYTIFTLALPDLGTPPVAPPALAASFVGPTDFVLDITGYTQAQLDNITHWRIDMATNAGYSVFPNIKWHQTFPAEAINNKRLLGMRMFFGQLVSGTTYYIRIKAVNSIGESVYTTTTVTTT